jgi:chromosome transmission fidelity protein 1
VCEKSFDVCGHIDVITVDGRVVFSENAQDVEIKYLLLNPATHFRDVIDIAQSTILAGGTLSPVGSFSWHLFLG